MLCAMPVGLQAPGLTIARASRNRLPWERLISGMIDISVRERGAPNGHCPAHFCTLGWSLFQDLRRLQNKSFNSVIYGDAT
jgi:hypothetical protein